MERKFSELSGKTWGIIGLGAIGKKVAQIATAFGCEVIYYSASGKKRSDEYRQVDLDTLLKGSDIVSCHAPLNEKTYHLMDAEAFGKMKETALFINVGRGPIVNEKDLAKALKKRKNCCCGTRCTRGRTNAERQSAAQAGGWRPSSDHAAYRMGGSRGAHASAA